ncbi:MAG: macro domain-containing protein, partial [Caldilineaceae bacterium]
VNTANELLQGGGGVDAAIHLAAGPGLLAECRTLGGCRVGEAKLSGGYNLPARHIIHTVGPIWEGGAWGEAALLAACYQHALELAVAHGFNSIAFPAISTGTWGYPLRPAALIALATISAFLSSNTTLQQVQAVCFSARDLAVYRLVEAEMTGLPAH